MDDEDQALCMSLEIPYRPFPVGLMGFLVLERQKNKAFGEDMRVRFFP